MEWKVSDQICSNISQLLIKRIPFESAYQKVLSSRDHQIKDKCIQYTNGAFENIRNISDVDVDQKNATISYDYEQLPKGRMGQRLNIVRKKKEGIVIVKSKAKYKNSILKQQPEKGEQLIELQLEEAEDSDYCKLVQVMRKKKEKYSWVIEELDKKDEEMKNIKSKSSQKYITNFEGKILKVERRDKKQSAFIEKLKVRPMFRLKPLTIDKKAIYENAKRNHHEDVDLLKVNSREILRISQRSLRSDKNNFKSILNIIQTKKYLDPSRKNKRLK